MDRRSGSPFIHERDAVNEDEYILSQCEEVNNIADQMVFEDENEDDASGEDGPQVGLGAFVDGVWQDPIDPHPVPPRPRTDTDPDYVPEVMLNHLQCQ